MASFNEIKAVRLQIYDPKEAVDIIESTTFPENPNRQTAYLIDGVYYRSDVQIGAVESDYRPIDLLIGDSLVSAYYDASGLIGAQIAAIKTIRRSLARRFPVVKNESGIEGSEYQALRDLDEFYRGLIDDLEGDKKDAENNSTGRWLRTCQPRIAGGNI